MTFKSSFHDLREHLQVYLHTRIAPPLLDKYQQLELPYDYDIQMIAKVLEWFESTFTQKDLRTTAEWEAFVCRMFRKFWGRDLHPERRQKQNPQQLHEEQQWSFDTYFSQELEQKLLLALKNLGWPEHKAYALVWRYLHQYRWKEVAQQVEVRFGKNVTEEALRQWCSRDFKRVQPMIVTQLRGLEN